MLDSVSSHKFSDPLTTNWFSLHIDEQRCINNEFRSLIRSNDINYTDPCKNPSKTCEKFCENSKLIQKHLRGNGELTKLFHYMSHPPNYHSGNTSWLVPFCYQGDQVDKWQKNVRHSLGNLNLDSTLYGYDFCNSGKLEMTDIGMCTTIKYKEVKNENNDNY